MPGKVTKIPSYLEAIKESPSISNLFDLFPESQYYPWVEEKGLESPDISEMDVAPGAGMFKKIALLAKLAGVPLAATKRLGRPPRSALELFKKLLPDLAAKPTLTKEDLASTTEKVATRMIDWASEGGRPLGRVLEPHGGTGALVKAIQQRTGVWPTFYELSGHKLRSLRAQKIAAEKQNFFGSTKTYDTIFMNPPFSKGQSKLHIAQALELLNPGGRGVSVVPSRDLIKGRPLARWLEEDPRLELIGITEMPSQRGRRVGVGIVGFRRE